MSNRDVVPVGEVRNQEIFRRLPVFPEDRGRQFQFSELVDLLWEYRKRLFIFTLLAVVAGILYLLLTAPVYKADALLEIEPKPSALQTLTNPDDTSRPQPSPVSPELLVIKSRTVLGHVVDKLNLDISARPVHFPVIGGALARWYTGSEPASPWFDMKKYAWGGEQISLAAFNVPNSYRGRPFTLVASHNGGYDLYDEHPHLLASGQVGTPLHILLNDAPLTLLVSELHARPGTNFTLMRKLRLAAISDLQQHLGVAEQGDDSGMVTISLEGPDRKRIAQIVQNVAVTYHQQSIDRSSAKVEKTLSFIEKQLPVVKARLEKAQTRLKNSQLQRGAIDLPMETQSMLQQTVDLETELAKLKRDRAIFLQRYTPKHPEVASLNFKIAEIEKELKKEEQRVKRLPKTQQEIMRLQREVGVSSTLYEQLMSRAQELRVVRNGPLGNVRIVDQAAASVKPVKPRPGLILVVSLALGLVSGVGSSIFRKIRDGSVDDPDTIETHLGLPVYAAVPASRHQRTVRRRRRIGSNRPSVLALAAPHDVTIEALRSLRTSLRVARANAENKALLLTSPAAGAGKSFVAANLATVFATAGQRVLLIDADMRTGALHKDFGIEATSGLSDILAGTARGPRHVIYDTAINGLSLLPAGDVPHNPAELLLGMRFNRLLNYLLEHYDEVIIDSPPVLAVTDAAVISHLVGTTVLIVRDGVTPLRDIDESIRRLSQAGANLRGVVFNAQRKRPRRYGYGYGGYAMHYPPSLNTNAVPQNVDTAP